MLNAIGPSLNQVSSLNSSVGEKTFAGHRRRLVRVEAEQDHEHDDPADPYAQNRVEDLAALLIPCFSAGLAACRGRSAGLLRDRAHQLDTALRTAVDHAHGEGDRVGDEDHQRRGQTVGAAADQARERRSPRPAARCARTPRTGSRPICAARVARAWIQRLSSVGEHALRQPCARGRRVAEHGRAERQRHRRRHDDEHDVEIGDASDAAATAPGTRAGA